MQREVPSILVLPLLNHVYPVADRIFVLSHGSEIGVFRKEETSIDDLTDLITLK